MTFGTFLILCIILMGYIAMFIFPVAALVLVVVFVVRRRWNQRKMLFLPGVLILISLGTWNLNSFIFDGPDFYFHHDTGSKVYNEGYIIPHYDDMYGETLELVNKDVIDSCNAIYTLKSGITGDIFTVESRNYETGSGSLDRLHLTAKYGSVLGKRLENGETVTLPTNEGISVESTDGRFIWFVVYTSTDGYTIKTSGGKEPQELEFSHRVEGEHVSLRLEQGELILEIPVYGNVCNKHILAY